MSVQRKRSEDGISLATRAHLSPRARGCAFLGTCADALRHWLQRTIWLQSSMIDIIKVGNILEKKSQFYTAYSPEGLCPTLSSGQARYGGLPTYIIEAYEDVQDNAESR